MEGGHVMNNRQLSFVFMVLMSGVAVAFLFLLMREPAPLPVERRVTDAAAERAAGTLPTAGPHSAHAARADPVDLEGALLTFDGRPGDVPSSWPRFRGFDFQNAVTGEVAIAEHWSAEGPPVLWRVALGEGYAGPAVADGRVFILDYDEDKEGDALRCFSLADGREIWRRWYRAPLKRNHGFSRTVPAVTDEFVVTVGPRCLVMCVRPAGGEFLWGIDLVAAFGTEVPLWYTGQCPLIEDGVAVLAPGGRALLAGIDCATGEVVWQTPNPEGWNMSHSSIVPARLLGRRMYIYAAKEGLVGVSAEPADRGTVLWKTTRWAHSVTAPSPMPIDDRRLFLTAGYGGGSMMVEMREEGDDITVEPLYELDKTVFACEQHTPLLYRDHLFAVLPKDAGPARAQFACMDLTGKIAWTSGQTERFGLGPFLRVGERMFILDDDGTLSLIRASLTGYELLARARVLTGREAWAPMAWVEGRLLLRDFEELICLDLRPRPALTLMEER